LRSLQVLSAHGQVDVNTVRAMPVPHASGPAGLVADEDGLPLLHLANRLGAVQALLDLGADPTATDRQGRRADEYWASKEGRAAGLGGGLPERVSLLAQGARHQDQGLALAAHLHNFHMADTKRFAD